MTYPINEAIDESVEAMKQRLPAPTGWSDELVADWYGAAAAVALEVGGHIVVDAVTKRVQTMFMAAGVRAAAARLMPYGGPFAEADGGPFLAVQPEELEDLTKFLNAVAGWFEADKAAGQ